MAAGPEWEHEIARALGADRHRLRRQLRAIRQAEQASKPFDRNLARFTADLERSIARREARRAGVPKIVYDADLPVVARREDIAAAIANHQVVIVAGETGSGKSTQLPKICLELGRGIDGLIGHTQPRRIAARSVAARVAEELGSPVGQHVGFKIRFTDATGPNTYVKLMTDGILLAETQHDRFLDAYDTLIIDEAHERSLNIDFLLGYIKRLLPKRPDLKLIITSATIDAERYAEHFASDSDYERHHLFPPLPLGEGRGEGERGTDTESRESESSGLSPHPNPLPEGEGTGEDASDGRQAAPVIQVSGRTYPVEVRWRPLLPDEEGNEPDWQDGVVAAVQEAASHGFGDVLLFMPTERHIHDAAKALRGRALRGGPAEILPLYARLSTKEQQRIFQPHAGRRIVITTNVAESSLTVPGIHYVIDPGTARISRYSPRSRMQRLPIEAISQASADQRKGRCGRVGPGVCFRLYSEEDYLSRERFTPPEIQRTNLASVILQTKALRLGPIEEFPFLDPPKPEAIRDGYKTLFELGALDEQRELTELGRTMSRIPADPRIARIILAGHHENCLHEILIIAAALEVQDPRERPLEKQQAADETHARFAHEDSDFLSYLKLWEFYHGLKGELSRSQLRKACRQNFLSYNRMLEWVDVHRQLQELVRGAGMDVRGGKKASGGRQPPDSQPPSNQKIRGLTPPARQEKTDGTVPPEKYTAIHKALLTGFLSSLAHRPGDAPEYTAAGGTKAFIWPGSGAFAKKPKWIVSAELVETSRRYLRTIARIDPGWVEALAPHLVTRTYSEPHWDAAGASAMAFEKVTLFGLPIVPRRRVRYGAIDPAKSRELFLQHGLVEGDYPSKGEFAAHNRALIEEIETLQTKSRQPGLLLPEEARYEFFDRRVPADVYDGPRFEKWRRTAEREDPRLLFMQRADVMQQEAAEVAAADFPDAIPAGPMRLPLEYHFEPGSESDGVTLTVPMEALNQVDPQRLGWLVPGLLEEKIVALIKSLPKDQRRVVGPAPEAARRVMDAWWSARSASRDRLAKRVDHPRDPFGRVAGVGAQSSERSPQQRVPGTFAGGSQSLDPSHSTLITSVPYGHGSLPTALAETLSRLTGERIRPEDFQDDKLPPNLRMNIRVVDDAGKPLAAGRDLGEIRRTLGAAATATFTSLDEGTWTRDGITAWDFGDLPKSVELDRGGMALKGYPALLDRGDAVSLRLLDTPERSAMETRRGVRRLFVLSMRRGLKSQVAWLPRIDQLRLLAGTLPGAGTLDRQLADLIADRALFGQDAALPRTAAEFERKRETARERIGMAVQDVTGVITPLIESYQQAKLALERAERRPWRDSLADLRHQLAVLTAPGFLTATPWEWLRQYPRYFQGIVVRLEKLGAGGEPADRKALLQLFPRWKAWYERARRHEQEGRSDPELVTYRWMLEEWRVSLFAQKLGTAVSVSEQRLDKQWVKVQK